MRRDRRACGDRNIRVPMRRIIIVGLACALGAVLASAARSSASRAHCGPALCIRAERGWYGSVSPGCCPSAAWVLFGNFWLPAKRAGQEGYPAVPRGKVLIVFSDFPLARATAHWPHVSQLRLPATPARKRVVSWHVRFAGRSVYVTVKFGSSRPNARMWQAANAKLKTVHRRQR